MSDTHNAASAAREMGWWQCLRHRHYASYVLLRELLVKETAADFLFVGAAEFAADKQLGMAERTADTRLLKTLVSL